MKTFYIIIAVIVVVVVGWYVFGRGSMGGLYGPRQTPTPSVTVTAQPTGTKSTGPSPLVRTSVTFAVGIRSFAFNPATVTVKKGDKVVWTNSDSTPHTVTASGGAFSSGTLQAGQSYTLDTSNLSAGTYGYSCSIHPTMHGTLIVQ